MMQKLDLSKMITLEEVHKIAKETKFVQRSGGKIDPFDFFMTLVFRMATSIPPGLRLITSILNIQVSRSAVDQKFTERACLFFRRCLQLIMLKRILQAQPIETNLLKSFNRVLIFDSSSWDICENLKNIFPGSGGSASEANCKIQVGYDYKSGSIVLAEDMKGTFPDQKYGETISTLVQKGDLTISDLGYWAFKTFHKIDKKGGFWLSRFNTGVKIWELIDGEYKELKLEQILKNQTTESVEIECYIRGENKDDYLKIRLIAFRAPEEVANLRRMKLKKGAAKKKRVPRQKNLDLCDWSLFTTNAPEELLPGHMIRSLYRVRWCVELIFKSWRSILRMHLSNVKTNHYRLKCELYAKFVLAVIVHTIHQHLHTYLWQWKKKRLVFTNYGHLL